MPAQLTVAIKGEQSDPARQILPIRSLFSMRKLAFTEGATDALLAIATGFRSGIATFEAEARDARPGASSTPVSKGPGGAWKMGFHEGRSRRRYHGAAPVQTL